MKKYVGQIIGIICVIVLFLGIRRGLNYILTDDTKSLTRIMMHQLYNPEDNIDVLFVGSSHVYRSLIPEITDEAFQAYTFNAGSSNQAMDGSLAIIKEAIIYNDVKKIYLETYYDIANMEEPEDRTQMTGTYIIADYMRPSWRKIAYLFQASSKKHYSNSFIIARRNWEKIFDLNYINELLDKKNEKSYKEYEWVKTNGDIEYYVDRGFVANDGFMSSEEQWNAAAYGNIAAVNNISKESNWRKNLQRIIDLCEDEGIELTLFVAPMPEWTIVGKENYDEYSQMVRTIAKENNIGYYDFNLCKSIYFDADDRMLFKDADHLNTQGAERFSQLFGEFSSGMIKESELFYDSLETKIQEKTAKVYGMGGPYMKNIENVLYAKIVSNRPNEMEYRIVMHPKEKEAYVIQNFDLNAEVSFPKDEHGIIEISWRLSTDKQISGILEVAY